MNLYLLLVSLLPNSVLTEPYYVEFDILFVVPDESFIPPCSVVALPFHPLLYPNIYLSKLIDLPLFPRNKP